MAIDFLDTLFRKDCDFISSSCSPSADAQRYAAQGLALLQKSLRRGSEVGWLNRKSLKFIGTKQEQGDSREQSQTQQPHPQ